jgi:hypothetical protein
LFFGVCWGVDVRGGGPRALYNPPPPTPPQQHPPPPPRGGGPPPPPPQTLVWERIFAALGSCQLLLRRGKPDGSSSQQP